MSLLWILLTVNLTFAIFQCRVCVNSEKHARAISGIPIPAEKPITDKAPDSAEIPIEINVKKTDNENHPPKNNAADSKPPSHLTQQSSVSSVSNVTKSPSLSSNHKKSKNNEIELGAIFRGVLVCGALGMLFVIYLALKTYCRRRNKQPVMVQRYGVRARRSDIEMAPLSLAEDEEDETLFDVGHMDNYSRAASQSNRQQTLSI